MTDLSVLIHIHLRNNDPIVSPFSNRQDIERLRRKLTPADRKRFDIFVAKARKKKVE